jgi:hypothetical protein
MTRARPSMGANGAGERGEAGYIRTSLNTSWLDLGEPAVRSRSPPLDRWEPPGRSWARSRFSPRLRRPITAQNLRIDGGWAPCKSSLRIRSRPGAQLGIVFESREELAERDRECLPVRGRQRGQERLFVLIMGRDGAFDRAGPFGVSWTRCFGGRSGRHAADESCAVVGQPVRHRAGDHCGRTARWGQAVWRSARRSAARTPGDSFRPWSRTSACVVRGSGTRADPRDADIGEVSRSVARAATDGMRRHGPRSLARSPSLLLPASAPVRFRRMLGG